MVLKNLPKSLGFTVFLVMSIIVASSPTIIDLSHAIDVTPDTRVEMHDVVLVNYTLWIEENIVDNQEGSIYVEDPDVIEQVGVPESIIEQFPDVFAPPNLGFVEGILGMRAGEEKNHRIEWTSGKAFNNVSEDYYGKDLFYHIILKKILLDASTPPVTIFDLPFFMPLVILTGLLIILLIILRIQRYSRTHDLFRLKKKCYYCRKIANVMCGNPGCNTPYCKKCFLENNGCDLCHSNTMIPLK
ncbi:MAG: hypothetical protein ACFFFH_06670 [Candidatus Thorarchaeota archaeon]